MSQQNERKNVCNKIYALPVFKNDSDILHATNLHKENVKEVYSLENQHVKKKNQNFLRLRISGFQLIGWLSSVAVSSSL